MQTNALSGGPIAPSQWLCYATIRLISRFPRQGRRQASGAALLSLFFLLFCLGAQAAADTNSPRITLSRKNVALPEVFKDLQRLAQVTFVYNTEEMQKTKRISIDVKDASLEDVLALCFQGQPLTFKIVDKIVIVQKKEKAVVTEDTTRSPRNIVLPYVKGKVTDEQSNPVAKATITVKGTDLMTATDNSGEFMIEKVPQNATLIISSIGYQKIELRVSGYEMINAQLRVAVSNLDETVVVAYNTTTQRANTGAVTVIKGEQIATLPNRSFDKSLQGLVPGLLVTSGTGQPGGGVANFVVRGIATGASPDPLSAARNPLVVVDGVPVIDEVIRFNTISTATSNINPMAQLNPSDIESISILKDASAISLYGAKASNGVILITTKKGKAGKTTFTFRHQTDISTRLNGRSVLLNKEEYLELLSETYKNTNRFVGGVLRPWTDEDILADLKKKFPVRSNGSFYPEVDWVNEIFKKRALTLSNQLSISGGNDRSNFYLSFEYTKQDGVVRKTGYDRKSIRFNFENRPTHWFKIGMNTTLSHNQQDFTTSSGSSFPVGLASITSPLIPVYLEDGSYYWQFAALGNTSNPVAANQYSTRRNTAYRGLSTLTGTLTPFRDLKITSLLGFDFMLLETREKWDPKLYDPDFQSTGSGRITEQTSRSLGLINTNTLIYGKQFNHHSFQILLGQEAQIQNQKNLNVLGRGFQNGYIDQLNSASTKTGGSSYFKLTQLSYLGQVNYSYLNRYYFSGSIRKDGSSKFGENQRFGTYWSTGLGWVISEEKSLIGQPSWLDFLKIRGSIGAAGNAGTIDRNTKYDLLSQGGFLEINNVAVYPGGSPGNPNIRWEETFNYNVGIDVRLWKGRISLTADKYIRKTSDLLYVTKIPLSSGFQTVLDNIGTMENKGTELSISADLIRSQKLNWNFSIIWSNNKNKLTKANVPLSAASGNILANEVGRNFNSFYMPVWAGVDPETGASQWLNTKGAPTKVYSEAANTWVGKPQPDGMGSIINTLKYENFQLSATLYYQYGYKIYDPNTLKNDGYSAYINQEKSALNRWQKPGDIAQNPKRTLSNLTGSLISTRNLYNGDHIRLQNVQMSYSLPRKLIGRIGLSAASVFIQGYNLALWTGFGSDNDVNNMDSKGAAAISTYPDSKSYSIGFSVSF